ncbi:hypothetical protein [Paracerasibacillus soli]|uniref:Uncharacterized protein n=1 Tax=Paracerasibacillus soli TaxID=480284 RepID=A0ABU5CSK0_9BACI|nr:hypothetical protein [Virgibacillus soli]MDY0409314.1 hypothetical protein [Virgibacillus soli]
MKSMKKSWLLLLGIVLATLLAGCMAGGSDDEGKNPIHQQMGRR